MRYEATHLPDGDTPTSLRFHVRESEAVDGYRLDVKVDVERVHVEGAAALLTPTIGESAADRSMRAALIMAEIYGGGLLEAERRRLRYERLRIEAGRRPGRR